MKRKGGLFKKAHELSVLCNVDVAVIIFGSNKKLYEYSSGDIGEFMTRYQYVRVLSRLAHQSQTDIKSSMEEPTNTKVLPTIRAKERGWMMTTMTTMDLLLPITDQLNQ